MNTIVNITLQDFAQKLRGYNMLFNYRLMNLCVKAEPAALMPVTVEILGKEYNLEEVAEIRRPDEYHLEIRANNENNLDDITGYIFDVHPEFILEMKTEKDTDDNEHRYASYSMPDVDKDRYDLLTKLTKSFYDECTVQIDAAYAKEQAKFVDLLLHAPAEDADEAKGEMKTLYDDGKDEAEQIRDAKLMEIEEAYQHYLEGHPSDIYYDEDLDEDNPDYDVVKEWKPTDE